MVLSKDKYNVLTLSRTSQAWTDLSKGAIQTLKNGGIPVSYISNIQKGRGRPERDKMGKAVNILKETHPMEAERIAQAYLLDACPPKFSTKLGEILEKSPLITSLNSEAAPSPQTTTDPVHLTALHNLRNVAALEPIAREAIILISKHL